jgi:hypothetical protein
VHTLKSDYSCEDSVATDDLPSTAITGGQRHSGRPPAAGQNRGSIAPIDGKLCLVSQPAGVRPQTVVQWQPTTRAWVRSFN